MASQRRKIQRNGTQIKRAVAYGRFSSSNQRDESIDAQLRAIGDYCEREGIQLVEVYTDEAQSATTDNRDDFMVMIDALLKGKITDIDAVLVHKFNRFARNKYDSALYKKRLRDMGIKVISVTQPIDDSPEGRILESMIEAMDEYYSENLALEVKKGMLENALKGKHTGGGKLLGLSVDSEGYYYPDENAHIVKRIFNEFANGVPKLKIVERLNREGYRNQYGRPFNVRTLYDLLQNEKYIGNFVYNHTSTETIRLDGIIKEPIIDADLWEVVQEKRKTMNKPKMRKKNYFMTGALRCGVCGFTYCGSGSKKATKSGEVYRASYYKCAGKDKNKNGCTNTSLNKEYYEKLVTDTITDAILTDSAINNIAEQVLQNLEEERKAPLTPTKKLKQQLEKVKKQQEKLMELYIDGGLDKKMLEEKNRSLKEERKNIERQIEKNDYLENSQSLAVSDIVEFMQKYKQSLKDHTDEEYAQIIFNTFVEKIVIYPDLLDISLRVDFSTLGGDKMKDRGANRTITPLEIKKTIQRDTRRLNLGRRKRK